MSGRPKGSKTSTAPKTLSQESKELREVVNTVEKYLPPQEFMLSLIKGLPCEPPNILPSVWAEKNRFMTSTATPFPGRYTWKKSPMWREPLDRLSPADPAQKIAIMKGTQVGFTCAVLENAIGYAMACEPMPMAFISGDERLISRAKKTRIEPMIESSGLADKIRASSLKKGIRRTGDSGGMMEFPGGFLTLCGPNSESNFQGLSYRMLLLDEVDLYPHELGRSGETVKVIEARADAFKARKKILYGSRPTVAFGLSEAEEAEDPEEEGHGKKSEEIGSRILDLYNAGDQRKYMVPCPHCGKKQELVFFPGTTRDGKTYGIMFDSEACKNGDFSSVHYQCRFCEGRIEEYHKSDMIQEENGAEWVPTAKPKEPYFHSYHMSALYSLFAEWWEIVNEFLRSKSDPSKLQLFYNRFLGLPFEDRTGGIEMSKISDKTGGYAVNSLPALRGHEAPLFLTAAADVQTGKNGRLECEIKAWGRNWRNWSIDYRVFKGTPEDVNDRCWKQLAAVLDESWGNGMQVERMLVDSGDGNMTATVYDACRRYGQGEAMLMLPSKGLEQTARTRERFLCKPLEREGFPLIEIYVDAYKNRIANWMRQDWRAGEAAPIGWPMFPNGYDRKYFTQLTNEERVKVRKGPYTMVKWVKRGRNEAFDIFVYNAACAEFVIEDRSKYVLDLERADAEAVWNYFEVLRDKRA